MHGLGNDFVLFDARQRPFDPPSDALARLADRHTGIGCDQFLIIDPPHSETALASYRIFNADGGAAEQCLNGLRCIALFLHRDCGEERFVLDGPEQSVTVEITPDQQVTVQLPSPIFGPSAIHWREHTDETQDQALQLDIKGAQLTLHAVSLGNPHAVAMVTEPRVARARYGVAVSTHENFSQGINAGFVRVHDPHHLELAVFERGAGPTRACGSGACAAAAAAIHQGLAATPVAVKQPGGTVMVDWRGDKQPVTLSGPATYVFCGEIVNEPSS